jgi:hypothetical protein
MYMKKFVMGFFVAVLCSATAHAIIEESTYRSTDELPAHSAIDGLWDVGTARLACPRGYVVGKRYCWDYAQKVYSPCGVFCAKQPNPPGGGNGRSPEVP